MPKTTARRYCKVPGCTKIIKSQGLCQRHGAKTRLCKVDGCPKQAQGNFDGMCKSHFKQSRVDLKETMVIPSTRPPPPSGQSVYDSIIPASLAFRPSSNNPDELMPLVAHLKQGFEENRPRGWHRNDERRARGLWPVSKAAVQLQGWERELVWMEICILSGNNQASFRHLARAWGRDKGFHMVLAQFICERRGNVERKRRPKRRKRYAKNDAEEQEEYMGDMFDFEDYEFPIDMLGSFHHGGDGPEEVESSEGGRSVSFEGENMHAGLQQHEAVQSHAASVEPIAIHPPTTQQVHQPPPAASALQCEVIQPHAGASEPVAMHPAANQYVPHPGKVLPPQNHVSHPGKVLPPSHDEHGHDDDHHHAFVDPLDEHLFMTQQQEAETVLLKEPAAVPQVGWHQPTQI